MSYKVFIRFATYKNLTRKSSEITCQEILGLNGFKSIELPIFSNLFRIKNAAVHDNRRIAASRSVRKIIALTELNRLSTLSSGQFL